MTGLANWAPLRRAAVICAFVLAMAGALAPQAQAAVSQIGEGISSSELAVANEQFGTSTAISRDGKWMIVGARMFDSQNGAAWIYKWNSGSSAWDEVTKLTPVNAGSTPPRFGHSVAIDEAGKRVVVGGIKDDNNLGAAWVFVRDTGDDSWSFEQKLIGSNSRAAAEQGTSVAIISAGAVDSGNVIVVGGQYDGPDDEHMTGAVWMFSRVNTTWSEQHKLVGTDTLGDYPQQGYSVALGSDSLGSEIVVASGGFNDGASVAVGATWIFTCNGTSSCSQTAKLVGTGNIDGSYQGYSVALSQVGDRLIVGAPNDNQNSGMIGAAWIFERSTGTWLQEGSKLVPPSGDPRTFGLSVAMSSDGYTALIGAPGTNTNEGAAWLYVRSNGSWIAQDKIKGVWEGNPLFGAGEGVGVSMSGDGNFLATGAPNWSFQGGVWAYGQNPTITEVSPALGPEAGGTSVTIKGSGFGGIAANSSVTFGGSDVQSVAVQDPTRMLVTTPAHAAGAVDVEVVNSFASATASSGFIYGAPVATVTGLSPTQGSAAGGTTVIVTGTNFTGATKVEFGTTEATGFTVNSATQITATAPAHTHGGVFVTVTTPSGTSTGGASSTYTYQPEAQQPTVTALSVSQGSTAGGGAITLTGTNFTGATSVKFGATAATPFTVVNATTITTTIPAHAAGAVNVRVTGPGGTSPTAAANVFTYKVPPVVTSLSVTTSSSAGGGAITLRGTGFAGATAVKFGATAVGAFNVVNATTITTTIPARSPGQVNVTVTTGAGTSAAGSANLFTYFGVPTITKISPETGPTKGGTLVSIVGTNLLNITAVKFGTKAATSFSAASDTMATATAPKGAAGIVDVTATGPGGTSAANASARYTYKDPKYRVLWAFKGGADGALPNARLVVAKNGAVYGTTSFGGNNDVGTVFKLTPGATAAAPWTKTIIHQFTGANGARPSGGLVIDNVGNLYGVTSVGGVKDSGVVYKLTSPGFAQTVLYSFKGKADGYLPAGGLARTSQGVLYGTTAGGGIDNNGTVFKISPQGAFTTLVKFNGLNGKNPRSTLLLDADGNLYGTTVEGDAATAKNGLVFKIFPEGPSRSTLYTFKDNAEKDGTSPKGQLFSFDNTAAVLFGTTLAGGTADEHKGGTVFKLTQPSTKQIIHSFKFGQGSFPMDGVVGDADGLLYGTGTGGGEGSVGVIYKLLPPIGSQTKWTFSVLYSFKSGASGARPETNVVLGKNRTMYGTTSQGGVTNGNTGCTLGCGAVYSLEY